MNDIKVPPFTEGQKELIKMTEKIANGRKICDVDDIDDDIKDIKEMLSETIAKIENQKQTNFQRITASPEALAEFIVELVDDCTIRHECGICHSWCDEKVVSAWLKQESETE